MLVRLPPKALAIVRCCRWQAGIFNTSNILRIILKYVISKYVVVVIYYIRLYIEWPTIMSESVVMLSCGVSVDSVEDVIIFWQICCLLLAVK